MLFELDFYDVTILLKGLGYKKDCYLLADYLTECSCDEFNIKCWVGNLDYMTFKNKKEALEYVKGDKEEDYTIYESEYFGCLLIFY